MESNPDSVKGRILWGLAALLVTFLLLVPLLFPNIQKGMEVYLRAHPVVAPIVVIVGRFIGIVVAPLPGAPLSFASMAVLPWWQAWIYNLIGVELGAVVAFWIARRFREPATKYFIPLRQLHAWQEKVSNNLQFWGFAALRASSSVAFDFVSYAAGLTKLPFRTFLVVTLMIDLPTSAVFFYLGGVAARFSLYFFLAFAIIFLLTSGMMYWQGKEKI